MKIIKFNTPVPAHTIRVIINGTDILNPNQTSQMMFQTKGTQEYQILKALVQALYATKQRQRKSYAANPL